MSKFRKILFLVVIFITILCLSLILTLTINKGYWLSKIERYAKNEVTKTGLTVSYKGIDLEIFPPRIFIKGARVSDPRNGGLLVRAGKTYVYANLVGLVIPAISPITVRLIDFECFIDGGLIDNLGISDNRTKVAGKPAISIPTFILNRGNVVLTKPSESIIQAKVGVEYLYLRTWGIKSIRLIYDSGEKGIEALVKRKGRNFKLNINKANINSRLSKEYIKITNFDISSDLGNVNATGFYDLINRKLDGNMKTSLRGDKIVELLGIPNLSKVVGGGKFISEGKMRLDENGLRFDLSSKIVDLKLRGKNCSGIANCVLEKGVLSLKDLSIQTPAGSLTGKFSLNPESYTGKGKFFIRGFKPGEVTRLFNDIAGISAMGTGDGSIEFESKKKGELDLSTHLTMEKGFTLIFPQEDSLSWNKPVEIISKLSLKNIFMKPSVKINVIEISKGENTIAARGEIKFAQNHMDLKSEVDIRKVSDLSLKGIFAKTGEISGHFHLVGPLDKPTVNGNMTLKSLSLRSLPPGELILKGTGVIDSHFSVIADYNTPFGTMTFTGSYFPSNETQFLGNLKARNVSLTPFFSSPFMSEKLLEELREVTHQLIPLEGRVSFDGDLELGKGFVLAKGEINSKELRNSRMTLESVNGLFEYDSGRVKISRLSCKALGGEVELALDLSWPNFTVDASLMGVTPEQIGRLAGMEKGIFQGDPMNSSFKAKIDGKAVRDFNLEVEMPEFSFYGAEFKGVKIAGELDKKDISISLNSDDSMVKGTIVYGTENSSLTSRLSLNKLVYYPDKRASYYDLGNFGINLSGNIRVDVPHVDRLLANVSISMNSLGNLDFDLSAYPFFSEYEEVLPSYYFKGEKTGKTYDISIKEKGSDKKVLLSLTKDESHKLNANLKGSINTGKLPFVLPSDILALFSSDVTMDLSFQGEKFPYGTRGDVKFRNLDIQFKGEEVRGEKVNLSFKGDRVQVSEMELLANNNMFSARGEIMFGGDIDLSLEGAFDAGIVRAIVKGVFESINGKVSGKIDVGGTYPDIEVLGQGKISDTNVEFVGFRHGLENANGQITFFKDRIIFDDLNATISGGELDGSGEISIYRDSPVTLFFSVDVYDMDFSYPEDFPSRLEGSIELLGKVDDLLIRGDVNIESATYREPVYPENFIMETRRKSEGLDTYVGRKGFKIGLDVECASDGTIRIRNNVADGTVRGNFRVLGDTSNPYVIGGFESVEGEIHYRGIDYSMERLFVEFDTPLSNNPRVEGLASTEVGDRDIFVEVDGRLDDLRFDFYSDPPLSKTDIVSLLSFGRTMDEISSGESSSATTGLATVAFASLRTGIEDKVRTFTGLERFSVETRYSRSSGTVEPMAVLGKDLGRRFSIDFNTSLASTANRDIVSEYRLTKEIYLRGDWGTGKSGEAGGYIGGELRIKKYYDNFSDFVEKIFGGQEW